MTLQLQSAPPSRKDRGADATKARLIAAAESEFAAKGFDGARLGNIARVAGVQQALIHHYFADKQGLYEQVVSRGLAAVTLESWDVLARLGPVVRAGGKQGKPPKRGAGQKSVRELTEAFVDVLVRFYASHSALLAIMRHDMQAVRPRGAPRLVGVKQGGATLDAVVRQSSRPVFEAVVRRIEELKAEGTVRQDVDARHLCVSAMAMACFPLQETRLLSALWPLDWTDPLVLEARKREIVTTVLARALP